MYQFHIWRYENWRLSDDFNQNDYCKSFDFSHFHGQKKQEINRVLRTNRGVTNRSMHCI